MQKNTYRKIFVAFFGFSLFVSSLNYVLYRGSSTPSLSEEGLLTEPFDISVDEYTLNNANKEEKQILVKGYPNSDFEVNLLDKYSIERIEKISFTSDWNIAYLKGDKAVNQVVKALRRDKIFTMVDYDYISEGSALNFVDFSSNPKVSDQYYLETSNIFKAWDYMEANGGTAGGSSNVVVAVIDTGVDYNHQDLRSNMWVNPNEIPNNGIDDDSNGYIDDIYGANCLDQVGNNGNPMDDHGHGTHVAGIIAASNNNIGTVGVAYNSKIMALKAGTSSGYFTNSSIAKAVLYAYENGADVINMSFGGSSVSVVVQDALEVAYGRSVLVASAGNDRLPNEFILGGPRPQPIYPAAFPFVIGTMSHSPSYYESPFTNWDVVGDNTVEYELYAPGEGIMSLIPNNSYAKMSGTSMASPIVSGIAALVRSLYPDKNVMPVKAIMAQLSLAGGKKPILCSHELSHNVPNGIDALAAISEYPKPQVNLHNYHYFDGTHINQANNANEIIDAGETIDVGLYLKNKGGLARDVNVSINVERTPGVFDSYITTLIDQINFSNIGTYSVQDSGEIYDSENGLIGVETPLRFNVSSEAPNDYYSDINVEITWKNGLDLEDQTIYSNSNEKIQLIIHKGVLLPTLISSDTTLTNDKLYILNRNMVVQSNATLYIQPGTTIQWYASNPFSYEYQYYEYLRIVVNGSLIAHGTETQKINFKPSETMSKVGITISGTGYQSFLHCNFTNYNTVYAANSSVWQGNAYYNYCYFTQLYSDYWWRIPVSNGSGMNQITAMSISYSVFDNVSLALFRVQNDIESSLFRRWNVAEPIWCQGFYKNIIYNSIPNGLQGLPQERMNQKIYASSFSDIVVLFELNPYTTLNSVPKFMPYGGENESIRPFTNLYLDDTYVTFAQSLMLDYLAVGSGPILDFQNFKGTPDFENMLPFVLSAKFYSLSGLEESTIGASTYEVRIKMSRTMDTNIPLKVEFGSVAPYRDYTIEGDYVSETEWRGLYTLESRFESGINHFTISDGRAATDHGLKLQTDSRLTFNIDTTEAQAMNLQAIADLNGVSLSWTQDDYETIAGYNVYRSTSEDGLYRRVNSSIIPNDVTTFLDQNVEPGVTYYYNFTVVLTDLSESLPSGKTSVTTYDSMAPNIYHTPISTAYFGNNLIISATITDNVGARNAKLYYRTKGTSTYQVTNMTNLNSKYSAVIDASYITSAGLEYYIEAYDGTNYTFSGTSDSPYSVICRDRVTANQMGDVNGDGQVTVLDALMMLQAINDIINLDSTQFERADLNGDGILTAAEALRILQYANGSITTL